jgi:hypothetical protein
VEEGIGWLLAGLLELLVVGTGKVVVKVASFGRWRGENISSNEGRIYSAAGSLWFRREGRIVVTSNGLLFVGIIFYVLLIASVAIYLASEP